MQLNSVGLSSSVPKKTLGQVLSEGHLQISVSQEITVLIDPLLGCYMIKQQAIKAESAQSEAQEFGKM